MRKLWQYSVFVPATFSLLFVSESPLAMAWNTKWTPNSLSNVTMMGCHRNCHRSIHSNSITFCASMMSIQSNIIRSKLRSRNTMNLTKKKKRKTTHRQLFQQKVDWTWTDCNRATSARTRNHIVRRHCRNHPHRPNVTATIRTNDFCWAVYPFSNGYRIRKMRWRAWKSNSCSSTLSSATTTAKCIVVGTRLHDRPYSFVRKHTFICSINRFIMSMYKLAKLKWILNLKFYRIYIGWMTLPQARHARLTQARVLFKS